MLDNQRLSQYLNEILARISSHGPYNLITLQPHNLNLLSSHDALQEVEFVERFHRGEVVDVEVE